MCKIKNRHAQALRKLQKPSEKRRRAQSENMQRINSLGLNVHLSRTKCRICRVNRLSITNKSGVCRDCQRAPKKAEK